MMHDRSVDMDKHVAFARSKFASTSIVNSLTCSVKMWKSACTSRFLALKSAHVSIRLDAGVVRHWLQEVVLRDQSHH